MIHKHNFEKTYEWINGNKYLYSWKCVKCSARHRNKIPRSIKGLMFWLKTYHWERYETKRKAIRNSARSAIRELRK